jgi:hypothetical protein
MFGHIGDDYSDFTLNVLADEGYPFDSAEQVVEWIYDHQYAVGETLDEINEHVSHITEKMAAFVITSDISLVSYVY